jgi:hypothetical protein
MHLFFRVKPELSFHAYEYQNKGPIHAGMADITIRSYAWGDGEIKNYLKYRQEDDLDLLGSIDSSVASAMDALGDDLKKYLKEADPTMMFPGDKPMHEHHKKEQTYPDILDPFVSIFKGFGDIFSAAAGGAVKATKKDDKGGHGGGHDKKPDAKEVFKNYKTHHRAAHFATEASYEAYMRYKMGPGGNLYWIEP